MNDSVIACIIAIAAWVHESNGRERELSTVTYSGSKRKISNAYLSGSQLQFNLEGASGIVTVDMRSGAPYNEIRVGSSTVGQMKDNFKRGSDVYNGRDYTNLSVSGYYVQASGFYGYASFNS